MVLLKLSETLVGFLVKCYAQSPILDVPHDHYPVLAIRSNFHDSLLDHLTPTPIFDKPYTTLSIPACNVYCGGLYTFLESHIIKLGVSEAQHPLRELSDIGILGICKHEDCWRKYLQ